MSFYNQGSRPVFASTQDALKLVPRPYNDDNHTIWVGGAVKYVSVPSEIDFDQARGFVSVFRNFFCSSTITNNKRDSGVDSHSVIKRILFLMSLVIWVSLQILTFA